MTANQSSPPSSSASSTNIEGIQGQLTLAQLVNAIEAIIGTNVEFLTSGRRGLVIYCRKAQPPMVDPNLAVDAAVAQREAHAVANAQPRIIANKAVGRHQVSPKRAKRVKDTIYFNAVCEDNESYSISWRP